jgi:hypothetical protein
MRRVTYRNALITGSPPNKRQLVDVNYIHQAGFTLALLNSASRRLESTAASRTSASWTAALIKIGCIPQGQGRRDGLLTLAASIKTTEEAAIVKDRSKVNA